MLNTNSDGTQQLRAGGIQMPHPASVYIDPSIDARRIAPGVIIHPGCRITGASTSIGPGCILGAEAPVTLEHCQLGNNVTLSGGFFSEATFLNGASMGSGAHIRPGTLIEDEAGGAHTVGLKQTILFPYTTLGSLINFCDCLMSGGTSRKNHGEVGSSYIHFNFTPHQDKATPSLIGDVPHGVMLDQPPVFLGGQGGMVGPLRVAFGTVIPAGCILRKDVHTPGLAVIPAALTESETPYRPGEYKAINRLVVNNLNYIGNLIALHAWYRHVRGVFMNADPFQAACHQGALRRIDTVLAERIRRLGELAGNMSRSLDIATSIHGPAAITQQPYIQQHALLNRWPTLKTELDTLLTLDIDARSRQSFLNSLTESPAHTGYLEAIKMLPASAKACGITWLNSIVTATTALWTPVA